MLLSTCNKHAIDTFYCSLLTWEPDGPINGEISSATMHIDTDMTDMHPPTSPTMTTRSNNQSMPTTSDAVFAGLLVRCVVQLELVDAIHEIVFGPGVFQIPLSDNMCHLCVF